MAEIKQSISYTRSFCMRSVGLMVSVALSKAGGTFAAPAGAVSEIALGWYKIALTVTDTGTLGDLAYHCTAPGADALDFCDQVFALGLDDLGTAPAIAAAVGARAPAAETYAADGAIPTYDQFLFMLLSALTQFSIAGSIITAKKLDGATQAMAYSLDDAANPTSRVRSA